MFRSPMLRAALVGLAALTMFLLPEIAHAAASAPTMPAPDAVSAGVGAAVERAHTL